MSDKSDKKKKKENGTAGEIGVELTVRDLMTIQHGLTLVDGIGFTVKQSYRLTKIKKKVNRALESFSDIRNKLIAEIADKHEEDPREAAKWKGEAMEELNEKASEILDQKESIKIKPIAYKELLEMEERVEELNDQKSEDQPVIALPQFFVDSMALILDDDDED